MLLHGQKHTFLRHTSHARSPRKTKGNILWIRSAKLLNFTRLNQVVLELMRGKHISISTIRSCGKSTRALLLIRSVNIKTFILIGQVVLELLRGKQITFLKDKFANHPIKSKINRDLPYNMVCSHTKFHFWMASRLRVVLRQLYYSPVCSAVRHQLCTGLILMHSTFF